MFHVMEQQDDGTWIAVLNTDGSSPITYGTGAEAYQASQSLKQGNPNTKYKVQRVEPVSGAWRARERERFDNGTYTHVPWNGDDWYHAYADSHFAHMSIKQPGYIAYTESPEKGDADRQTIISPGRYLRKYALGDIPEALFHQYCASCRQDCGDSELNFARSSQEIRNVYLSGPKSCMSHDLGDYESHPYHPVEVYGDDSDITLAYIRRDNRITARALVWEEKKVYSRPYGDIPSIEQMLDDAGYIRGSFEGAKIRRLLSGDDIVLPYIDSKDSHDGYPSSATVSDHHNCLIIHESNGDYDADATNGIFSESNRLSCEGCALSGYEDDFYFTDNGITLCEPCYLEIYSSCENCNDMHRKDDMYIVDTSYVCFYCYMDDVIFHCNECGEYCWEGDLAGDRVRDQLSVCRFCAENMIEETCGQYRHETDESCECDECKDDVLRDNRQQFQAACAAGQRDLFGSEVNVRPTEHETSRDSIAA